LNSSTGPETARNAEPPALTRLWPLVSTIDGWLTREQAGVLFAAASRLPEGSTVVEIGSHRGRSTVVLAGALPAGARLVAVDPFDPAWRYGGADTRAALERHLAAAGVADRVEIRATSSRAARATYDGPVDLLYVDGKHDYRTVRDDLRWADRVPDGGTVLVHDAFSSLGVTTALLSVLPRSRDLTYTGRTGSLAHLRKGRPSPAERLRPLAELPWWVRNLVVKVLLRLRLRPVAGLLGHRGEADPF
jgi:predicted O-methyltransferase YrrM